MIEPDRQRLLIVEDDPEIGYLLGVILAEDDREVVSVTTGAEAERVLAAGDIDLIVLDLILPDVDGRTLLARLRARPTSAAVPVVVISARGGAEIREDCFDLGADFFTEKPFDPDALADDIAARLERAADQEMASHRDPVTGLPNLAGLAQDLTDDGLGYSVGLVQLDGFVGLSERWGWADAETVVRQVGSAFDAAVVGRHPTGRIGGGEFAYVVSEMSVESATEVGERLLDAIRDLAIEDPDGETIRVTASIGIVAVPNETPLDEAFDDARRRLFQARAAGGNRVLSADPEPGRGKRVLVAEDDEISATILTHRLRKDGLEITRFDNGKAAYEAAIDDTPSLVILDVKMPGMDGFEVLERLRRTPSYATIPIILLTSMGSEADVVRGFQLGADDYILKPFAPVELSARVWRLLRRGRSTTAL